MKHFNLLVWALFLSFSSFAVVDPIVGPTSMCSPSVISLTNATPGGTWSSSALAIASVSLMGFVTAYDVGTANITYTVGTEYVVTTITVNPTPLTFVVSGGGSYCSGGTGVNIGLMISHVGVSYQLYLGSTAVGSPLPGTGSALNFGPQTTTGTYSINATGAGGCTANMTGSPTVSINALPTAYTLTTGGACTGNNIVLSGSDAGTNYQLLLGGAAIGSTRPGTGLALDFGTQTLSGVYTVTGTNATTACVNTMGSATINPTPVITGASAVCVSSSITLTGTGTWSSSTPSVASINTSGVVTGHAMGTTTITCTNPTSGCFATRTITVTTSPGAITGPSVVCNGTTTTFTNSIPGGLWSSLGIPFVVGSSSGSVSGITSGTGTLTYSLGTGCIVTKSVTVNTPPAAITGPTALCVASTVTLTNAVTGGTWSSSSGVASIGSTTGIVTGLSAGTATISYTLGTVCSSVRIITVTATSPPISGPSVVCVGATITESTTFPGGIWTSSNPTVAAMTPTGIITGISAGVTTIEYSVGTGCSTAKTITINPAPIAFTLSPSSTTLCSGSPGPDITLSGSSVGVTYQLFRGGAAVGTPITGTGLNLNFGPHTIAGTYAVSGTDGITGCGRAMTGNATINVTTATTITGPSSVCVGSTISLTIILGSAGTWTNSNPAVASVTTGGLTTGLSVGSTVFTYVTDVSSGSCIATHTINVTPATCSGTPAGGTANASASTVCYGNSDTLSLTGASTGCGFTYQWQASPDGTTFTDIPGGSSATYIVSLTATQHLRCKVTCVASGLFDYSSSTFVTSRATIASHNIVSSHDTVCNNLDFYIRACGISSSFNVTTWFGDGTSVNTPLTSGSAHVYHSYNMPGTYEIKQVLYIGTIPQDSVTFSHEYLYCRTLPVKFYIDGNSNCTFDAWEKPMVLPVRTAVDSNGITIDTISATSGFYYKASGPVGTIYSFRVISIPGGLYLTCPTGGILRDTIKTTVNNYHPKYFGINCASGTGSSLDFVQHVSTRTGRHTQIGTVVITNSFCITADADVTLHFNPGYRYHSATPAAASHTDSTAIWHLTAISSGIMATYPIINYHLETPSSLGYSGWFTPGDTVHSTYVTIAPSGDIDPSNNVCQKKDTVKSSFDPNDIAVSPGGYILPCTKLQYTVRFENDGNDTAHNIYVLDTLPNSLDPRTLNIEVATAAMNVAIIRDGPYQIAKFDFPNIKLPDSSHHGLCNGMIIFNIKTKPGIADGTVIPNQVGIYFDDNPPVMTNTIQNVIGIAPIAGPNNLCPASTIGLDNGTTGGTWSSSTATVAIIGSATGTVSGITAGISTISYSVGNSCGSRSATTTITVNPNPIPVTGPTAVCIGGTTTLSSTGGGTWSSSNTSVASIGSGTGTVTGVSVDTATIAYVLSTGCKTTKIISVQPTPSPITGTRMACAGATTTLADATPSGTWYSSSTSVATVGPTSGIVTGVSAGTAIITYTLGAGCAATLIVTINPLPTIHSITGGGAYCSGGAGVHVGLSSSTAGVNYFLYHGSSSTGPFAGTGSALDFGLQTLTGAYSVSAINTATTCNRNMPDSAIISITPHATPSVTMAAPPGTTICAGTPVIFVPSIINGGVAPIYLWTVNGTSVSISSSYSFLPANGDVVKVRLTSSEPCAMPDTVSTSILMNVITSGTLVVTITPSPGSYVAVGETVTFTATVTGGGTSLSYQWYVNGISISGATNSVYVSSMLFNGDVVKCAVDDNGPCITGSDNSVTITLSTTELNTITASNRIIVFPNPNKGVFNIKGSLGSTINGQIPISVTDMLGRTQYDGVVSALNGYIDAHIQAGHLAAGVYLLTVHSGEGDVVAHFVVGK